MKKIISIFLLSLLTTSVFAALQDLDEAMYRKANRYGNTFFSGESGAYYFWQPETLTWTDTETSHEVWRMTLKPSAQDVYSREYSTRAFSADGSRLGFFDCGAVRSSTDPSADSPSHNMERWILNSNGLKLRAGTGGGWDINTEAFLWKNTENAYIFNPSRNDEFDGALTDAIYKVTIDANNGMSRSILIDINDDQKKYVGWAKDCLSSNDAVLWTKDVDLLDWPTPNDINSQKFHFINLTNNTVITSWGSARGYGPDADPYNNHIQANEGDLKGGSSYLVGPNGLTIFAQDGGDGILFEATRTGSAVDGGPDWEDWDGDSFGTNEEIKALMDDPTSGYEPHNPYGNGYPGHMAIDRWGHYASVGFGGTLGDPVDWGDGTGHPGRIIADLTNNGKKPSWQDANNSSFIMYDSYNYAGHASWTAWSDYTVVVRMYFNENDSREQSIQGNYYTYSAKPGDTNYRAPDDIVALNSCYDYNTYHAHSRPTQSPDGTKVAFASVLFHSDYDDDSDDDDSQSLAYVVSYYPHPPEITACTVSAGTVTTTFEWMLDSTPRGYTTRGWPNESTDDPPPPRETEKFRLWRSADKSTWTPISTVDAEIFTRYDFSDGTWDGNDYWTITDTPGDGTWYYAVTAVEWSGLESHCLSNIYSITISGGSGDPGAQDTAYPSSPGDLDNISASDFYTSFNTSNTALIRYYNIYADDGATPTATQTMRVASIPAGIASGGSCSWVDWLGNTNGTTQYVVTAVDTQGNESNTTFVTSQSSSHKASPATADGQYTLTWDDMTTAVSNNGVSGNGVSNSGGG